MFFVDKPYVSDFFKKTVKDNNIPIVATDAVAQLGLYSGTTMVSGSDAIKIMAKGENPLIYTTSDNSIGWIAEHFAFSALPEKIDQFKDKLKFRHHKLS